MTALRSVPGPVEASVRRDLARFPAELREGGVAAAALLLAHALDTQELLPRDVAGYTREIRLALAQLRDMAPGQAVGDITDEVRERREKRISTGP